VKSFEIAKEIGYYYGCALLWEALMKRGQLASKGRRQRTLTQLLSLIRNKLSLDPLNPHLQEEVDRVRYEFASCWC
jgi:hypothetical protein